MFVLRHEHCVEVVIDVHLTSCTLFRGSYRFMLSRGHCLEVAIAVHAKS